MTSSSLPATTILAIRPATADDAAAVTRLAALDSAPEPTGDLLLAVADGRALAAVSVATGAVVADPFSPTADLVAMLEERAARVRVAAAACSTPERRVRGTAAAQLRRARRPFAI